MNMRVADLVAKTLANYGARLAFGMPGGEVITLIDALNAAGVRFVLARHETPAAIMAAGAAVASGGPGVLVTTVGPGLANAVNGIADASQEHVPLVVLSGVVDHAVRGRYTHQVLDQKALLRSVVKGCFEVEVEGAAAVVARAVELALSEPMGPVLIELSPGTAERLAAEGSKARTPPHVRRLDVDAHSGTIDWLQKTLASAERPLIVAGWTAVRLGGAAAVTAVAERFGCPVITTYKGKGLIPEHHPLSLGAAGLSPLADRHLLPLVAAADVVVLAGYDPIEMRPGWLDPFSDDAEIVEVSPSRVDHGMHRVSTRIDGDVAVVLSAAAQARTAPTPVWPDCQIRRTREALSQAFALPTPWGPHAVIATLERHLPANSLVTVDSGAHRILLSQMMQFPAPQRLLQSAGFCTMGAALPLAIGAKCSQPERAVFAVVGDGGFEMGLGELATLRDQGLPVVVIVFQDESLALIELKQRQSDLKKAGVSLGRTPYEDVARAFGGRGTRVASRSELEATLRESLDSTVFSVIVCEIKASDYAGRI